MTDHILLPLQQHPRFALALRQIGNHVTHAPLPQGGQLQVLRRFGLRFASRGPVWGGVAQDQRSAALRQARLHLINAETDDPALAQAGFRQTHSGAYVAELRLDDDIIPRAHPKWRARWRKAEAQGCTIRKAPWDAQKHHWLLQADLAQQRRARFRALPHALIPAYAGTARDAATVYTAHLDNVQIAAMLFLRHAPVVTYHLGWTSDLGRDCGAHHRMLIRAAQDFHAEGFRRLDLGTVDTHHAPGLARFKIGTGAQIRQLGGTWIKVPGL